MAENEKDDIYLEITLTNACNCKCSYCFEGSHCQQIANIFEEEKQLNALVKMCETFDQSKHNKLIFSFWGGEPFVNFEYMLKILEHTHKYDFVKYHCYSNGTLTDKIDQLTKLPYIDKIKDRFSIQLSYDGEPHNTLKRGYGNEKILKAADILKKAGIKFSFKATLSYDMIKFLPEIWKSYEELHDRYLDCHVRYFPTLDTNETKPEFFDDWKKSLIEIAKLELQFFNKHGFHLWAWFQDGKKMTCKLKNTFHMHTDGNIYICHGAPYVDNKNVKLGKIETTENLNDIVEKTFDTKTLTYDCIKCCSTQCAVCHITLLKPDSDIAESWTNDRANDKEKCKYYKYFGYVSKLLKYCILKQSK